MKILFISMHYKPEPCDTRTSQLAAGMVEAGHKATVITSFPNYPFGKIYDGYKKDKGDECKKCVESDSPSDREKKKKCFEDEGKGRQDWVDNMCDYYMDGSIDSSDGSDKKAKGHQKQACDMKNGGAKCNPPKKCCPE